MPAMFAMACAAHATDVSLVGLYAGKALVVIDGGRPFSIPVGVKTPDGVKLLSIEEGAAHFEIDGRKQRLGVGQHAVSTGNDSREAAAVSLTADSNGHFSTVGTINGAPVRFLVDTGATLIAMGKTDASRANVDYQKGQPAMSMTANGPARIWKVTLNSVRVGDVILNQVDAAVHEQDLPIVLLGMSFLNRMEMKRDGQTMTLKKRY
ncbi:MAG TPA: TIGR02281 family clan AA aspartic protease [Rhodocyclaceae bacterium]|nr:TIGR02281 family clan AA aspartic protease [Rhodocyclaceae bacterium]